MYEENFAPEEFMLDDDPADPTMDPPGESVEDDDGEEGDGEEPVPGVETPEETM